MVVKVVAAAAAAAAKAAPTNPKTDFNNNKKIVTENDNFRGVMNGKDAVMVKVGMATR